MKKNRKNLKKEENPKELSKTDSGGPGVDQHGSEPWTGGQLEEPGKSSNLHSVFWMMGGHYFNEAKKHSAIHNLTLSQQPLQQIYPLFSFSQRRYLLSFLEYLKVQKKQHLERRQ